MDAGYSVTRDDEFGGIRIALRGFWDMARFDAFERSLTEEIGRLGSSPTAKLLVLVDVRDFPVQDKHLAERMQAVTAQFAQRSSAVANLMAGDALQRLQANRIAPSGNVRFFTDDQAAKAWLMEAAR